MTLRTLFVAMLGDEPAAERGPDNLIVKGYGLAGLCGTHHLGSGRQALERRPDEHESHQDQETPDGTSAAGGVGS